MLFDRDAAANRYLNKLRKAQASTMARWAAQADSATRVTSIDRLALGAWERDWQIGEIWPWPWLMDRHKGVGRFEMALWSGEFLCGLAVGVAKRDRYVAIKYIQGWQKYPRPLQGEVIPAGAFCGASYAVEMGASKVRFDNPVPDPNVRALYAAPGVGFHLCPATGNLPERFEKVI
jgi:hypothetical protein